jgi:hypothetical protein
MNMSDCARIAASVFSMLDHTAREENEEENSNNEGCGIRCVKLGLIASRRSSRGACTRALLEQRDRE